uniref:Uncharacterized protein n=1 Tax=Caenorhabditis japonica TaxID=281687 RepID=A0A8R1EDS3_CAEJA
MLSRILVTAFYYGFANERQNACKCCIMDLRGRIDWYSVKTLNEAKALTDGFTEPEKHEMKQIFSIFDKLPRVK